MASSSRNSRNPPVDWTTEFMSLHDIVKQILINAEVLFPRLCDMRVITGRTSKTEHYAAIYARDTTTPEICKNGIDFRMIAQGPNEIDRRTSVMKLLDDIEKRVAKEVMKVA